MALKFNPAPGWPEPPSDWSPSEDWQPDPSWPEAPPGWQFWIDPDGGSATEPSTPGAPHASTDALEKFRRPGDIWAAIGRPLAGLGAMKVRMDKVHLFVERGLISTDAHQIPLAWVVDVDASQSPTQKLRGVGSIQVRINRNGAVETMSLTDLPDFRVGVETINTAAHDARLAETRLQHTQHFNYESSSLPVARPAPALSESTPKPTADEILSSIERLGRLHEAGALTDEEFTTKKAELLSRL